MAVTTTLAVMGGMALVGGGLSAYGAYENSRSNRRMLEAQKEAEAARVAAERAASKVRFDAEKTQANQYADTLTTQAGEVQKEADISMQNSKQQLASSLGAAADQSQAANKQVASLQGQVLQAESGIGAKAGVSGVKLSGSYAKALSITTSEGNSQVADATQNVLNGLKRADSGATSTMQGITENYNTEMFNKSQLTAKAAQTKAAYEEGGTAYNVYKANDTYTAQLGSIQEGLIQNSIDENNRSLGLNMVSSAFQGFSSGLKFGESIMNLASMFKPTSVAMPNAGSLLTSGTSYVGNTWDFNSALNYQTFLGQ